jgi:hypothetical protein
MPIRPSDLRHRGTAHTQPVREELDVPFDDLLYLLAEGIASAQTKLDLSTAELLETLAETEVDVVPQLTRRIDEHGGVETESAATESRSLLELGFTPTRYQFSEATLEVGVDIRFSEEGERESESEGRRLGLRAGTYEVTEQRKYDREVEANARINARLQPVPLPVELSPTETRDTPEGE